MPAFESKFNPNKPMERAQMIQLIHALAAEINNGVGFRINFFQHAKKLGWIPPGVSSKRVALRLLVSQAVQGFGYMPTPRIHKAMGPKNKEKK